ncbi:LAFE_0H07514g1_1 [Lachancea fermentati]|uniref:LAFE_0H07514g1_1 n=1 Tax=Lachancea fermentati TaxID=4955 RepID=A0A1G4MK36_LACFM|nr:LAFE_0H07514g1_1 [Lachancea fermentati]
MDVGDEGVFEAYYSIYNNEVKVFMDPYTSNRDLTDSYVHVNSKVKWLEDEMQEGRYYESSSEDENGEPNDKSNDDRCMGSLWTTQEKQTFFHFLSRYSIHRLDDWYWQLPTKSKFEIITYYEVLRANLDELKRLNTKKHGGILAKKHFPIAYEMDDFFIDFEEEMCNKLMIRNAVGEEATSRSDSMDLINLENWQKRWDSIYSKHGLTEYHPACRIPPQLPEDALQYLLHCVESYTRKLLWYVVLPNLEEKYLPTGLLDDQDRFFDELGKIIEQKNTTGNCIAMEITEDEVIAESAKKELPHVVSKEDVSRAITAMRHEGHFAPTLADSVITSLNKFNLKYESGKLFKSKSVAMGVVPAVIAKAESAACFLKPCNYSQIKTDLQPLNTIHKRLYNMNHKNRNSTSFIQDDTYNQLDNPLETLLCKLEEQHLEEKDMYDSCIYQHILLQYLSGNSHQPVHLEEPASPDLSATPITPAIFEEFQFE